MSTASAAVEDFLHHAAVRDLPEDELFELKARAFDLMAEQAAENTDAEECRRVAEGARSVAAQLARSTVLSPPDGVCLPCWMFTHRQCDRRASCTCSTCYPNRRSPSEGAREHA